MPSNWAYIPLSKELKTDIENFKKNIPREWQVCINTTQRNNNIKKKMINNK